MTRNNAVATCGLLAICATVFASTQCTKQQALQAASVAQEIASLGCAAGVILVPQFDAAAAPLCTDLATLIAAGEAVGVDVSGLTAVDAGGAFSPAARTLRATNPAQEKAVYAWLLAHGAVPLGG